MRFVYKAKKGPEEVVEGSVEAANQDAAITKIRQLGLVPVYIQKGVLRKKDIPAVKKNLRDLIGKKITKNDVFVFTKKLRVLLRSQEPILNSLYFVEDQTTNREFKKVIHSITESVREGIGLSESLTRFPQYFSPLYVSIIKAGEASGKLDYSLEQITAYMDNERQLSQKVLASLAYPSVMIAVGAATIIFIITFVVPKLRSLFEDLSDSLPLATKALLALSTFFSRYWLLFLAASAGAGVALFYTRNASWQKKAIHFIKKNTPILRDIIYNQSLCRFASGLSILLSSGVSLLDSIRISIPLVDDETGQKELDNACRQIVAGANLEESLSENCKFLPDMFVKMVAVGETSGRLDEILRELAESYSDEVETITKVVTSLIEPVAILVVGGILSFIVIAVLLPIFEMSLLIK